MMKTFDIREAQSQLSELLSLALEGHEIIIAEGGTPLARLIPVAPAGEKRRVAGLNEGTIRTSDDFDQPLPNE